MAVKKKVTIVLVIISIVAISTMIMFSTYKSSEACRKANAAIQWDCSVTCAEESTPDSYVITYSDAKILSKTYEWIPNASKSIIHSWTSYPKISANIFFNILRLINYLVYDSVSFPSYTNTFHVFFIDCYFTCSWYEIYSCNTAFSSTSSVISCSSHLLFLLN